MATKARTPDCRNCLFLKSMLGAGLPPATVDAICARMRLVFVRRRQVLHLEGNVASRLCAIRLGRIKLFKLDEAGREHVTANLESGDLFGFESVFGDRYLESAEALTQSELCVVSGAALEELLSTFPSIAVDLAGYLWNQISRAHERQVYLSGPGARAKVAGYVLYRLPREAGADPAVAHDMNLRELGSALGLAPETVCRALADLKADGIIESEPGAIRVRDVRRLRLRARLAH